MYAVEYNARRRSEGGPNSGRRLGDGTTSRSASQASVGEPVSEAAFGRSRAMPDRTQGERSVGACQRVLVISVTASAIPMRGSATSWHPLPWPPTRAVSN